MDPLVIAEQIAYYQARATEYEDWFFRRGRFDQGKVQNAQWFAEVSNLKRQLRKRGPIGDILELACGTGIWTRELVSLGQSITAIDASSNVLAINRSRLSHSSVKFVQKDLFSWEPDREFDMVFCSFWISHIVPESLPLFLDKVARATRPGGEVFMIDSRYDETVTLNDHPKTHPEKTLQTRELNDGSCFRIVKVFYEKEALLKLFSSAGLQTRVHYTSRYFFWVVATRMA